MADTIRTPVGIADYPNLQVPRDFQGDGNFAYDTGLIFSLKDEGVAEFLDVVNAEYEKAKETAESKGKPLMPSPVKDLGDGIHVKVKFKQKVNGKNKAGETFERRPPAAFLGREPLPADMSIEGGDRIRISFQVFDYGKTRAPLGGLQLQPKAVQLVEKGSKDDIPRAGGGGGAAATAEDFGFDDIGEEEA